MSDTKTKNEAPKLLPHLLAEIVADLPIHVLVQSVIGNRFWTDQVLPLLPRLTVTRVNDLDGDSAIVESLKEKATSLVLREDNVYRASEYKDLFERIASLESVIHLRLLNLGTGPERWHCVELVDCTEYLLRPMAPQLESLVMDGVHFLVEEGYPVCDGPMGFDEFEGVLKRMTDFQRLEIRNNFQVQYWGNPALVISRLDTTDIQDSSRRRDQLFKYRYISRGLTNRHLQLVDISITSI
ncbi:hypothetical protein FRACYDRAFT_240806 [Fragilariopsis cylindrus CCMP1102]|uniref:Uncharacterized protein n=1 Tax=Fragilariopsis cylindrus CCMP1102 TaxID=635003 RepID=A0A1E7F7W9_9STRA|nr:hypothetical protein FRACYDRAFT_240806 [Fragilariopsis cylindrus CCMP1102]|eukprot:OEU14271.1 hypothetical protein FRACYDRAFT_240806 [Fragilariopsis cylindrus CCMP1102]